MASNRHLGRIIVLQSLYEYEFRNKAGDATADIDVIVAKDIEPYQKALGDTEFVYGLARAVSGQFEELDAILQPIAPEWPLSTIAAVDRNILRMGLYELQNSAETVPPKVAINEAVELAKAFGSDNSSKFVNGVLGTAYRQIYEPETPAKEQNEQKASKKGSAGAQNVASEPETEEKTSQEAAPSQPTTTGAEPATTSNAEQGQLNGQPGVSATTA